MRRTREAEAHVVVGEREGHVKMRQAVLFGMLQVHTAGHLICREEDVTPVGLPPFRHRA